METFVTRIGAKYQVVIPKAVRESLRLRPNDKLLFVVDGGRVILRPHPTSFTVTLRGLHRNLWPDDVEAWLDEERNPFP